MAGKIQCPFCDGDGCCFCDHTGRVPIGEGEMIKSVEHSQGLAVQYLREGDPDEIWPEMWEFFLKEENVPGWFKRKKQFSMSVVDFKGDKMLSFYQEVNGLYVELEGNLMRFPLPIRMDAGEEQGALYRRDQRLWELAERVVRFRWHKANKIKN